MNIGSFKDFVEKVNTDLGSDFCNKFAYKRKELAGLSKAPTVRVLFVFVDDDRDWAINSGGGYEIQFHLYIRNNEVGYGLGFNTQYVPFNNSDAVECMKPFGKAFLELLSSYKNEWKEKGFGWIEGDGVKMLRNPHHQCYTLYGKKIAINNSQIDDDKYQTMLSDIKGTLFDIYKKVFKLKNTKYQSQQMEDLANMTGLLEANKNIILQGAPGTGKTYSTAALALSIIGISDVDFSDHVAVMKKYEALLINEKNKDGQIGFCTFHQSMDYEDFVEGLKPSISENGDSVTYKIEPGIFKIICDKALAIQSNNFDQSWNDLIEKLEIETKWSVPLISGKGSFNIELNEYGTGLAVRTYEDGSDSWIKGKSKFFSKDQLYNVYMGQPGVPSGGHDTYRKAVVQEMRKSFNLTDYDPNLPKNGVIDIFGDKSVYN